MFDVEIRNGWMWPKDDVGAWIWLNRENTFPQDVMKHVTNFSTCIHAGAHCGMYAKQYAYRFQLVYAIEPQSRNFYCLTNNVTEENVTKIQACLLNERKRVNLYTEDRTNSGGYFVTPGDDFHSILMDDLTGNVGLIQLDVEGYEFEALQGGINIIKRCSPVIALETVPNYEEKNIQAAAFLFGLGYKVVEQLETDTIFKRK